MPMLIDALLVELGIDTTKFDRGQKEAMATFEKARQSMAKTAKEIEKEAAQAEKAMEKAEQEAEKRAKAIADAYADVGATFLSVQRTALGLFAVFTAGRGIRSFVEHITTADAATGQVSKTIGMAANALGKWQGAVQTVGGSASGIAGAMLSLTGQLQNFALTGSSAVIPYFRALGISITDANGKIKTAGELFLDLNKSIQGMDPRRAAALLAPITGGDPGVLALLRQTPAALKAILDEEEKLQPTQADTDAALRRQTSWTLLNQALEKVGRTILTFVSPAIVGVLDWLRKWTESNAGLALSIATLGIGATAFLAIWTGAKVLSAIRNITKLAEAMRVLAVAEAAVEVTAAGAAAAPAVAAAASAAAAGGAAAGGASTAAIAAGGGLSLSTFLRGGSIFAALGVLMAMKQDNGNPDRPLWHGLRRMFGIEGGEPTASGGSASGAPSDAKMTGLMQRMMGDFGISREQAAGAVGWMAGESRLNPNIVRRGGTDTGYAQWVGERRAGLYAMAGVPLGQANRLSDEDNYRWMKYELTKGRYQNVLPALRKARNWQEALEIWGNMYEGAGGTPLGMQGNLRTHLPWGARAAQIGAPSNSFLHRPRVRPSAFGVPQASIHPSTLNLARQTQAERYLSSTSTTSHSVDKSTTASAHIGTITINTSAKDAAGIAREIEPAIKRQAFAGLANFSLV